MKGLQCIDEYVCFDGTLNVCLNSNHEWSLDEVHGEVELTPRNSNAAELLNGDAVSLIKDLKVKGLSMAIERSTKVKFAPFDRRV